MSTTEKSSPVGNMAAMREALLKVKRLFDGRIMFQQAIREAHIAVNATLATPPRNCDVGTLAEQQQRFHDFCEKMQHTDKACCGGCPIIHLRIQGVINTSCELAWAQMPYREAETKGETK